MGQAQEKTISNLRDCLLKRPILMLPDHSKPYILRIPAKPELCFAPHNIQTLQTDHQPFAYLNKTKYQNDRTIRWALALQGYD